MKKLLILFGGLAIFAINFDWLQSLNHDRIGPGIQFPGLFFLIKKEEANKFRLFLS